jgi:hypothetical protein
MHSDCTAIVRTSVWSASSLSGRGIIIDYSGALLVGTLEGGLAEVLADVRWPGYRSMVPERSVARMVL